MEHEQIEGTLFVYNEQQSEQNKEKREIRVSAVFLHALLGNPINEEFVMKFMRAKKAA